MSKVVYLLGAGASYGKRNDAVTESGVSRIIDGLPVVNEINDEIDVGNHGDRFLILPAINEDLYPLII